MAKNKLPAADVTEDPHYHDSDFVNSINRQLICPDTLFLIHKSKQQQESISICFDGVFADISLVRKIMRKEPRNIKG